MESVSLKQINPFRQKLAAGVPLIVLGILAFEESMIVSVFLIFVSVLVFTFSYNLIITRKFKNFYEFSTLGIGVLKIKKKLIFPDYISLFNQSFIQTNHEGFSPNTLSDTKYSRYTIKFFKENKNEIVFQSTSKDVVIGLGQDLCSMLNVELYNTLE